MYSPKIPERFIPDLYRLARRRGAPMTALVAEAVAEYLGRHEGRPEGRHGGRHEGRPGGLPESLLEGRHEAPRGAPGGVTETPVAPQAPTAPPVVSPAAPQSSAAPPGDGRGIVRRPAGSGRAGARGGVAARGAQSRERDEEASGAANVA